MGLACAVVVVESKRVQRLGPPLNYRLDYYAYDTYYSLCQGLTEGGPSDGKSFSRVKEGIKADDYSYIGKPHPR